MKTITIIFWIVIILSLCFYMAGLQISFKPFSIKFNSLSTFFGWLFLWLALSCFSYRDYKRGELDGYKKGSTDMRDAVIKIIDKTPTKDETKDNIK